MDRYNLGCCRFILVCLVSHCTSTPTQARYTRRRAVQNIFGCCSSPAGPVLFLCRAPLLSVIKRSVFFGFGAPNSPTTDMQVTSLEKQMTDLHKILV